MKRLFAGAIAVAGVCLLTACGANHGATLPNTDGTNLTAHKRSTHYAAVRHIPAGKLVANSKEYDYESVLVRVSSENARIFIAPQSVSSSAAGVRIVDGEGRSFEFPAGSTITRGHGRHYVLPGRSLPGYLAHARFVRTITEADVH